MARPLRIEYPGAVYHVTSRGNRRHLIFRDDTDRERFLLALTEVCKTYNWLCHAYCLMGNHYHLLVETPDGNLSAGMRDLNGIFTQESNRHHRTVGHIFQGRYKAFVIEKETYLLAVARYIVLNPVRAKLVEDPADWPWSSYLVMAGRLEAPDFLHTDWILGMFHTDRKVAQKRYCQFVRQGMGLSSPFADVKKGVILGSPQFVMEMWERSKEAEMIQEIPKSQRIIGRPSLKELFEAFADLKERNHLIYFARHRCGYSVTDIAKCLKIHRTTASRILNE